MRPLFLCLAVCLCTPHPTSVHSQDVDAHLAGGEFGLATEIANQAALPQRDPILAQIAIAQGSSGQPIAAAQTTRGISAPGAMNQAVQGAGANGGGSFADFTSLMDLIQTTVVPDTWEALGGPSTMSPYPGGVYVDSNGTLLACAKFEAKDEAANLMALLERKGQTNQTLVDSAAWRSPSDLRFVSMRRLLNHFTAQRIVKPNWQPSMDSAALHMAGLSKIKYVFFTDDDVVIAGPVGGIDTVDGWHVDRRSGLSAIRSDFFCACIASAMGNRPFGCTIDPTAEGLQRASQVSAAVSADQIPIGKAAQRMQEALGMQRVEVFGTAGDTPLGYLMVEADRHMKQLALGEEPMPNDVNSYLDFIDAAIAKGPPKELLLRLWFTAAPRAVRANAEKTVFEIGGDAIKLSGENQRALPGGVRGRVEADFRSVAFVKHFNDHWSDIRTKYPVYGALESIYRAASVAELVTKYATEERHRLMMRAFGIQASTSSWIMHAPRQVESIATHHSVRHGRQVHHVIVASGGVSVNSGESLRPQLISYPALSSVASPEASRPVVIQRWWWDIN